MRNAMSRRTIPLAALSLALLPFSSCTCSSSTPAAPVSVAERHPGFGAIVTPRKLPDRVPGAITPRDAAAGPAPTVPATPNQASVPDNFPDGVPIPQGSQVMAVQNLANDARNVIFSSDADSPELFQLYKDSMTSNGWGKPTQEFQGKDQSFLSFKKGDTVTNISVSRDPSTGKRVVAVMYYDEKPLPFEEF
jgi:hypothetical protein